MQSVLLKTTLNCKSKITCTCLLVFYLFISGCITHKSIPPDANIPPDFHVKDGAPRIRFDPSDITPAIPKWEPYSKYGNKPSYSVLGKTYYVMDKPKDFKQTGIASWYGTKFHGRRTSSWEYYDMFAMTAAHKTLPLPSYVKVTNLENKRSTIVRVNDRGPFHDGRIIDLSYAAAHVLGVASKGTAPVSIELITPPKHTPKPAAKPTAQALANTSPSLETKQTGTPADTGPATANASQPEKNTSDPGQLYLQVGAFGAMETAQNLQAKLMEIINHPVSISPVAAKSTHLLRVMVGPFQNPEDIHPIIALIQSHQLGNPLIKTW